MKVYVFVYVYRQYAPKQMFLSSLMRRSVVLHAKCGLAFIEIRKIFSEKDVILKPNGIM